MKAVCMTIVLLLFGCDQDNVTKVINVSGDDSSIQDAIDSASDGDEVTIACGVYNESLFISNKKLKITGSKNKNCPTVIDANGGNGLNIVDSDGTEISHVEIKNAVDGISTDSNVMITESVFYSNYDGIDFESGGGVVKNNEFYNNKDDAIDLDLDVSVAIEGNVISNSNDDGIEIRLHPEHSIEEKLISISDNIISYSGGDGIQFIDYEIETNRVFFISSNFFLGNSAAISYNDNESTSAKESAGSIDENVNISLNKFMDNDVSYRLNGSNTIIESSFCISESDKNAESDIDLHFICYK
ncbi:right-handed parallel beta-helix repeat-containing protein [Vibrio harveyi]|uniref:right-handed parallel beta-helix repeat-containing protein n=1 Tax=Vibrio harveyi TaxID=669 RepID=UPI000A16DCBB|nr:right-handed parallel beta-helix repeat-containing protein [Vibrio harveyi]